MQAKRKSELQIPQYGQSADCVDVVELTQTLGTLAHTKFPGHVCKIDDFVPVK